MRLTGPHLLPIQRVSTTDPAATLRWTGWILGITSLVTVVVAAALGAVTVPRLGELSPARRLIRALLVTMREAGARS